MNTQTQKSYWEHRWFLFAAFFLVAFVWGSTYILVKISIQSFSNTQTAGIRLLIPGLIFLPFAIKSWPAFRWKDLGSLLIVGFMGCLIPAFLFATAQSKIDSALAGMIDTLTPVFTLVFGILFFKMPVKKRQIGGLVFGFSGALVLIFAETGFAIGQVNSYALFVVLATIMYAIDSNVIQAKLSHLKGIEITSLSFLFTLPFSIIYLLITDFSPVAQNPDWPKHLVALCLLGLCSTTIIYLYNSLIQYTSAVAVASTAYAVPIFAIFWGLLDGEQILLAHIGGICLIFMGLYLINKR